MKTNKINYYHSIGKRKTSIALAYINILKKKKKIILLLIKKILKNILKKILF